MKQRRFRAIALQGLGNREKSNIAIAILEKVIIEWHHNYFVFWWYQQYFPQLQSINKIDVLKF